jgi:dolichol-phosphate mannosyltransferase
MKILAILPTYNEASNITRTLRLLRETHPTFDILHIDDNSPDGTGEIAEELGLDNYRQIRNFNKLGLGNAYIQGFSWALDKGYDFVMTMDSDGSHHIDEINSFLTHILEADLVIGTRWMEGGSVVNWPIHRKLLSKFGTWYAKKSLKLPFNDLTSGFRFYRVAKLKELDFSKIQSKGYVFQIQMVEVLFKKSARILEIPITFTERTLGKSKMSGKIAWEALIWITKARFMKR